jgi:two-component system NtrC family response regulator/two-component system response regulator AtoC
MKTTAELVESGRYVEALRALLRGPSVPFEQQASRDTLLAELFQYTGRDEAAVSSATSVLRRQPADLTLAARCHIALGEVDRNAGRASSAIEHFRLALDKANTAGDGKQSAWAGLRLLLAVADGPGVESAMAYLPTLRRSVARAGDVRTTAALHHFVAFIEAQRGLLDNAAEHVRIARSLMEGRKNVYFDAMGANDASCIAFSRADLPTTLAETRNAVRQAAKSGHAAILRAALTNLAHVELARGRFRHAERFFERAARISPPAGAARAGITDGLAQLALARGDLDEAERILATARWWTPETPKGTWYYGLWTAVTRGKTLVRLQRPEEAAELLAKALVGARELGEPLLISSVELALLEAQARCGDTANASHVLEAAQRSWTSTIDLLAEFGRVIGFSLAVDGSSDAGRSWFERGACALASSGNHTALAGLAVDFADAVAGSIGAPAASFAVAEPIDTLPPRPTHIVRRLDTGTPLVEAAADPASAALERAASVVDSGSYPPVVGHEIMGALFGTGCVSRAALSSTAAGKKPDVASWFGCSWTQARDLAAHPPRRIDLGPWQGREYAIAVTVPVDVGRLVTLVALERLVAVARFQHRARNEERERVALWPIERYADSEEVVFCSSEMTTLVASARKVAAAKINVMITGETGTGKEVVARVIHGSSPRADHPFIPFNCTAVPKDLADSQLFGHRKGAFTGATADSPGVIRAAVGGTLYLDEVGDLGPDVQPKLLRFLESGEIQTLGEPRPQRVDVRIIASTNRNLQQMVADGQFREDLFYRLNVVPLHVPPLRERREEVPPLAEHFLRRASRDFGKEGLHLAEETMEYLVLYRWPGNVRQLANEIRRVAALAEPGTILMPEHLDAAITAGRRTVPVDRASLAPTELVVRLDQPHAALIEHAERAQIGYALAQCGGRLEDAARLLGLSRKGLYLKRQRLGLE